MRVAVFGDIHLHEDAMSLTIARRYAELQDRIPIEVRWFGGINVMAQKLQREIAQRANDDYQNRDLPAFYAARAQRNIAAALRRERRTKRKPKKMRAKR